MTETALGLLIVSPSSSSPAGTLPVPPWEDILPILLPLWAEGLLLVTWPVTWPSFVVTRPPPLRRGELSLFTCPLILIFWYTKIVKVIKLRARVKDVQLKGHLCTCENGTIIAVTVCKSRRNSMVASASVFPPTIFYRNVSGISHGIFGVK